MLVQARLIIWINKIDQNIAIENHENGTLKTVLIKKHGTTVNCITRGSNYLNLGNYHDYSIQNFLRIYTVPSDHTCLTCPLLIVSSDHVNRKSVMILSKTRQLQPFSTCSISLRSQKGLSRPHAVRSYDHWLVYKQKLSIN